MQDPVASFLTCFLVISLLGCTPTIQRAVPYVNTPTIPITEVPVISPTPEITALPPSTPVYSYQPIISEANATKVASLDSQNGGVSSLAISSDGKYLAAAFDNGAGLIWDVSKVKYWWPDWRSSPEDAFLARGSLSFDPDGAVLATGGTLLELPSKAVLQELPGTVTFSPTGRLLALSDDTGVSLWKSDGREWTLDYKEPSRGVVAVAFSPAGDLVGEALDWGAGEGVKVWRVSDHTLLYSFPPSEHIHPAHFNMDAYAFLVFSPDNRFLATGTKDYNVIRIWNLKTGELIRELNTVVETEPGEYYVPDVRCASITQDSKVIVIVGDDNMIFKKVVDGEYIGILELDPYSVAPSNYVTACATSQDGKLLVVGNSAGRVSILGVPALAP